ncbi:MAG: PDZ domain-containing protein [Firmicutes bacterium]|nr:PDZ domain-containing protein [Bacillota bacterium]
MDFPWREVLPLVGLVFLRVLGEPFFWLVVLLVWFQYQRMLRTKEALFGFRDSPLRVAGAALGYGVLGGLVGSCLMVLFGISINGLGIGYLWLLAVALMLISPRFLCFSYAGGILALFSLVTGYPRVNIPALMGLVAVLHLVESVLILTSGHFDPLPVYVRSRLGRVVGAFNLQKFWPIPLAVMTILTGIPHQVPGDIIKMPDWWPLIRPWGELEKREIIYSILPVVAALGYGELAITCLPREKAKRSAFNLALFSLVLLGLAVLASRFSRWAVLPALFAPLGHEMVIYLGRRAEFQGKPRFVPPPRGVMVLDVVKGSPAARAGLRAGDVILRVEGLEVNSRAELLSALGLASSRFLMEFAAPEGPLRQARVLREEGEPLGVIPVPEPGDSPNVDYTMASPLKNLVRRLFRSRSSF